MSRAYLQIAIAKSNDPFDLSLNYILQLSKFFRQFDLKLVRSVLHSFRFTIAYMISIYLQLTLFDF